MLNTIALFIPLFVLLAGLELWYARKSGHNWYSEQSVSMNITLGAIDQLCSLLDFILLYAVLDLVFRHFRFFTLPEGWQQWVLAYVAVDFVSYWYHRFSHEFNILWAGHVTHHSADHFNLTNGFRGSPFQGLGRIPFWVVLPMVGFSPGVLVITLKISGIYDFWLHTQTIPKLGFFEKIFITPSMHRVHHGKNDLYIDKNYGSTFVIWDKMFGTYQEETEPVVYGIKDVTYRDRHPVNAIFHHYRYLWNMMGNIRDWTDKVKLLFMRPGWLPEGAAAPVVREAPPAPATPVNYRLYAIWLLGVCAPGVVLVLLHIEVWPVALVVWNAFLVITGLVGFAAIINGQAGSGFRIKQMMLLTAQLAGTLLLGAWYQYVWIWAVAAAVALLLLLAFRLPWAEST